MISFFIEKNQEGKLEMYAVPPGFYSKFSGMSMMFLPEAEAVLYLEKPEENLDLERVGIPEEVESIILERWNTQSL